MKKAKQYFLLSIIILQTTCYAEAQQLRFATEPNNRVAVGENFFYRFSLSGSNSTTRYSCIDLPSWIAYNKETNTLSGRAPKAGQWLIQIVASSADTTVQQHFMLTVYDGETRNILALGNSITNGTDKFNSYRRYLWQRLHKASYNVDFIGSWNRHHGGSQVPDPDFDMDHDGHSGWKASDIIKPPDWDSIRGNIDKWLDRYSPDIVLMELGTNEVFQCIPAADALKDFALIISKLRKKNDSVKIFLAQIPPLGKQWASKKLCGGDISYEQAVRLFNKAVVEFAGLNTSVRSPVIIVDQFADLDPATDTYDDIHPNEKGEKKMAERWFKAIVPFLQHLK